MTRRLILFGLLACAMFGLGAPAAQAGVHVDFLFGGHGHGHYHHHYHPRYSYWADYYYYAPPPVRYVPVAAPAPVVYVPTAVSAVAPATAAPSLAPTIQSSSQPAQPNLRANALPVQSTTREASATTATASVVVSNPTDSGGQVSFILDGKQEMTLAPGEKTTLTDGVGRSVEFDRGGSFGTTRVTLGEGSYEFAVTQSGWDLQRRSSVAGSANPLVRRNELPTQR